MMMKQPALALLFWTLFIPLYSQTPVQTVRGKVTDIDSRSSLPGANVVVVGSEPLIGATTDVNGNFMLEKVPVGRRTFRISFMGYKPVIRPEVMVSSGKETFLAVELTEETIQAGEVEIKATVEKDKPINPMAMVSARSFSIDESRRYAGSADDPLRAASSFAGVAASADVASNEIVVRGNSPRGLLWRMDGIDIPNPNHFAFVGNSGGGITMLSSQVLANSDFYTAAFPAQYGNALSGVFDLKFRNGNSRRHEFAIQVGIQGLDLSAEGPLSKKSQASYLFNYRYSILAFMQVIDPSLKGKMPQYQDLSFKISIPTAKAGTFSLVGIGGISRSSGKPDPDTLTWQSLEDRMGSVLNNNMGAAGLIHQIAVSRKTQLRTWLSGTYNDINSELYLVNSTFQKEPKSQVIHRLYRFSGGSSVNTKFGTRHTNRSGIGYVNMFYDMNIKAVTPENNNFTQVENENGNTDLVQAFTESKFKFSEKLQVTAGLYYQYFLLNHHSSLEPRLGLRWQVARRSAFSFGYGKHSQTEDVSIYLAENEVSPEYKVQPNKGLDFSRAHHFVLGYDLQVKPDIRFKAEAYYQYLYRIPVRPASYYSLINSEGAWFGDTLVNDGKGRNYGIDLTFEKFLTRQYYYLVTVSLYDSRYTGGDGIERNTRFNSNYVVNLLGGKEWTIRKKNIFGVNLKTSYTGGQYYVPIDLEKSIEAHKAVYDEAHAYELRLPDYLYVDLTLTYRTNHKRFSGVWAVQLKNLLNRKTVTGYWYNDYTQSIEEGRSIGLIPFISYKIEF